jgi:hypothetical protein
MATITDGQMEIAGILVVGDGTDYRLPADFVQWWAAPEVRTSDIARSGARGYVPGRDLIGKDTLTIVVLILADSEAELGSMIDAWKAACQSTSDTQVPVRMNLFGQTRVRFGRFRIPGAVTVDQWSLDYGDLDGCLARLLARGSAQFEALDGRTYDDHLHTAATGRTVPGVGFTPPFTPPFTPSGSGSGGSVNVQNGGNTDAPWTGRLDGPLTYPQISHLQSGNRLSLDLTANGGVDLAAGQWIDLDSTRRSVLLNGTADRRTQLTVDSDWWNLTPGANTFSLDADAGTGTLTVTWRDAYLT